MNPWILAEQKLAEAGSDPTQRHAQMFKQSDLEKHALDQAKASGAKKSSQTAKADAVMAGSALSQFEQGDFIELALLCIDQAGLKVPEQQKIEKMIRQAAPDGK